MILKIMALENVLLSFRELLLQQSTLFLNIFFVVVVNRILYMDKLSKNNVIFFPVENDKNIFKLYQYVLIIRFNSKLINLV